MFKRKGGGSKAFWTMLKKTALFLRVGFPNGSLSRARNLLPANLLFITSRCKRLLGKNDLFFYDFFDKTYVRYKNQTKKLFCQYFSRCKHVNSYFRLWTSSRAPRSCSPWAFHQVRVVFGLQKYLGEYFIFKKYFGEYFMYIRAELKLHYILCIPTFWHKSMT